MVILLLLRWAQVSRDLASQQPGVQVMAQLVPWMESLRGAIDDLLADPNMDAEAVHAGWALMERARDEFGRARELGADDGAMHFIRMWKDYAELGCEMFNDARRQDVPRDPRRWPDYRQRLLALDAKGRRMIESNPTPSFWKMLITGVPEVHSVE